jgi:hypothetical protein
MAEIVTGSKVCPYQPTTPLPRTYTAYQLCERDLPDFLVDGFIAHSLGPKHAEEYLSRFLRCLAEEPSSRLLPFTRGWLVERPSMTDAPGPTTTQTSDHRSKSKSKGHKTKKRPRVLLPQAERLVEMHRRLFDCQVDTAAGTVVPQTTWVGISSQTGAQSPIFFVFPNGSLGVPYDHLSWRYSLQYATAEVPRMLKRCNLNMRIRIKVRKSLDFVLKGKKKNTAFFSIFGVILNCAGGVFFFQVAWVQDLLLRI